MRKLQHFRPTHLLAATVALTLGLCAWLGWQVYQAGRGMEAIIVGDAQLHKLHGSILYLDEVLTMSARLAALSGDTRWVERYTSNVDSLDAAISETLRSVPAELGAQIEAETGTANIRLVELETMALAAVEAGRPDEARALLFSSEYEQLKQRYAQGMERLLSHIQSRSEAQITAGRRQASLVTGALMVALPLLMVVWAAVLRTFNSGIAARERLLALQVKEQTVAQTLKAQDALIAERTEALQTALGEVQARETQLRATLEALESSQIALRELSAPVLSISATTLVMPLIGSLDSARLAVMQARALEAATERGARTLILDITGVPVIDTRVAYEIMGLVRALHLMGVEAVLAGIRPEVAQTMVGLGVSLDGLHTYGSIQSALEQRAR